MSKSAERMAMPAIGIAAVDREYQELGGAVEAAVRRVFASGRFIMGPEVLGLEGDLAAYLGVKHVVTCANGTDALMLALRAAGVGAGDEVIVPAFTFAATAEAVVLVGATPVFADVDLESFLIDPSDVQRRLTQRTKAIIPVHLFGRCVDWAALERVTAGRGITLVEDSAQAIGSDDGTRKAGAIGAMSGCSFYPTKNLGAPGDGGMISTNDDAHAEKLRLLRAHGAKQGYFHEIVGMNSRLDEIQATVLRLKLPHLDAWNRRRRENAAIYLEAAAKSGLALPRAPAKGSHIYHHFVLRTRSRDRFIAHLAAAGIGHAIHYPLPLHKQKAFAPWASGSLPKSERAAAEVVALPVHPWLTGEETARIADALSGWSEP